MSEKQNQTNNKYNQL